METFELEHQIINIFQNKYNDLSLAYKEISALQNKIQELRPFSSNYSDIFHALDAHLNINFFGKDVLELGGTLERELIQNCLQPNSWFSVTLFANDFATSGKIADGSIEVGINPVEILTANKGIYTCNMGYLEFDKLLSISRSSITFGAVYSTACFEHIDRLYQVLNSVISRMDSSSSLYSYFAPTWEHPSGRHYSGSKVELEPYIHLILNPMEMFTHVRNKGLNIDDAYESIYQIYQNPWINRYSNKEYLAVFDNLDTNNKEIMPQFTTPMSKFEKNIQEKIRVNNPFVEDELVGGYRILMKK